MSLSVLNAGKAAGIILGSRIRTVFSRPRSPRTISSWLFGAPKVFARQRFRCVLAAPSTGVAVMRSRSRSPSTVVHPATRAAEPARTAIGQCRPSARGSITGRRERRAGRCAYLESRAPTAAAGWPPEGTDRDRPSAANCVESVAE